MDGIYRAGKRTDGFVRASIEISRPLAISETSQIILNENSSLANPSWSHNNDLEGDIPLILDWLKELYEFDLKDPI